MTVDWLRTGELRAPTAWSIGIYRGRDLFDLQPQANNPVLSAGQITDVDASFVADPFMIRRDGRWFMFFEVMNRYRQKGEIGLATSDDGRRWDYQGIVMATEHHLSYPFVFTSGDDVFMVPEEGELSVIRLFRARDFPVGWEPVHLIAHGMAFEDTTLFEAGGQWWAIASTTSDAHVVTTHVFHSDRLMGDWLRHPEAGKAVGRSAGRVVEEDSMIIRFVQVSARAYGESVRAHRIDSLSPASYSESPIMDKPLIGPSGVGWNAARMHTIDAHRLNSGEWIACVDGRGFSRVVTQLDRVLPAKVRPYEYPLIRE
jgi:hypothetical protein